MKLYRKVKIKRLFHGFASVRDYIVQEAKKNGQGLVIECGNEYLVVPYEKLDDCFANDEVFVSKHDPKLTYSLRDYDWDRAKIRNKMAQTSLF